MSNLTYLYPDEKPLVWLAGQVKTPRAIVILEVFGKKTMRTPRRVLDACRRRLRDYRQIR